MIGECIVYLDCFVELFGLFDCLCVDDGLWFVVGVDVGCGVCYGYGGV